jgi:hypothetical protein
MMRLMATVDERVRSALAETAEPICELCLAGLAGLQRQQQVNPITRSDASAGRIGRGRGVCGRCGRTKTVVWRDPSRPPPFVPEPDRAWHWEGRVVDSVAAWLRDRGCDVLSVADTATRQRGADILARLPSGEQLRVEAKGHPAPASNATQMARHYFSDLVTEVVILHGENPGLHLALALPRLAPFPDRAARIAWLRKHMALPIIWVTEDGRSELEGPGPGGGWWSALA